MPRASRPRPVCRAQPASFAHLPSHPPAEAWQLPPSAGWPSRPVFGTGARGRLGGGADAAPWVPGASTDLFCPHRPETSTSTSPWGSQVRSEDARRGFPGTRGHGRCLCPPLGSGRRARPAERGLPRVTWGRRRWERASPLFGSRFPPRGAHRVTPVPFARSCGSAEEATTPWRPRPPGQPRQPQQPWGQLQRGRQGERQSPRPGRGSVESFALGRWPCDPRWSWR